MRPRVGLPSPASGGLRGRAVASRRPSPGTLRIAAAAVMVLLAVLAALLANDVGSWQAAIRAGDTRFLQAPGTASWSASTALPPGLSERVLDLSGQIAFRVAAQTFVGVHAAGQGLDNGFSESQARDALETVLVGLTQGPNHERDSEAENLLGILAYTDSQQSGPSAPAPVERSVSDFQAAVELDPANEDAKFNLEWVLRHLLAEGVRPGSSNAGGPARGHRGASPGTPGRGY